MDARRIERPRLGVFVAVAVLALAALAVSAGIAVASGPEPSLVTQDQDDGGQGLGVVRVGSSGGSVTVPFGTTGAANRLPLTDVTVSGRCQLVTPPPGFGSPFGLARALLEAADGTTMDAFSPQSGAIGGQSVVTAPFADTTISGRRFGSATFIVTSNRATASITMGSAIDFDAGTCTFLWQAVESRNP